MIISYPCELKNDQLQSLNMNRIIFLLLMFCTSQLFSLEIWLNGSLYRNYNAENLRDLSYAKPDSGQRGIALYEILPVMDEIHSFRFISDSFILEMELDDTLFISEEDEQMKLTSDTIGEINLPEVLEIKGVAPKPRKLVVWFDEEDRALKKEIDLFANIHNIIIEYRVEKNINSLLEYSIFNDINIPDLVIFKQDKLNTLNPLLTELPHGAIQNSPYYEAFTVANRLLALPFKISRQVYLSGSSGGDNSRLVSDFGDLNLLYPLMYRFAMEIPFDLYDSALKDSLFYLKSLYKGNVYRISEDPDGDFLSGSVNNVYTSSEILGKMETATLFNPDWALPQLGEENPLPLLNFTLLAVPEGSRQISHSLALIKYLTDFGVQQRINPETGYLPFNKMVYNLLIDSTAKELLMENLENALFLTPDDQWDKFRFVIPKIYRLVITGRLTIDEGMTEIENYMTGQ